jgi:hypothetical protein
MNTALGVPADVILVGQDRSSDSGTVVATPSYHHETAITKR